MKVKGQQRKKDDDYVFLKKNIYIVVVFRKKWFTESYYIYIGPHLSERGLPRDK